MEILYIVAAIAIIVWLWLNILATVAVRYDSTLNRFQTITQAVFVWLIPFIGASFVLHLVWEHYPDAIPKRWIPWPFRKIILGKEPKPNRNRDNDEGPGVDTSRGRNQRDFDDFGGGTDGGGD